MRSKLAPALAVAALAAAALPASAGAASWSTPHAVASAGSSAQPAVAADARGRMAIGFFRRVGRDNRVEVRRGTTRRGLSGASILLERSTHAVDSVAVALPASGADLAAAWRGLDARALRLRAATIAGGRAVQIQQLTPDGTESAYSPAYVTGPAGDLRLVWSRRTTSAGAELVGTSYGAPFALPAPGVASDPKVAVDADGTTVVVWVDTASGRALAAQASPGGAFRPPQVLSASGRARDPQLAIGATGTAIAAWTQSDGSGNSVQTAARPRGGAFGAPVQVADASQRAFAPRLAATAAGEVLLTWVNTQSPVAFGSAPGILRLQPLGADGAPVAPALQLTPDGVRTTQGPIVSDGSGNAVVAWTVFRSRTGGPVQARRIAPGGVAGAVRTVSRGPVRAGFAPVLAGAAGRVVAAWVQSDDVRYSVFR